LNDISLRNKRVLAETSAVPFRIFHFVLLISIATSALAFQALEIGPRQIFRQGEIALKSGDLAEAERAFKQCSLSTRIQPGAYANLGVIYMRRKQWPPALEMLEKADSLAPQVAEIRLNIGLVHHRQDDYTAAIPAFESVVLDAPSSQQGPILVGAVLFLQRALSRGGSYPGTPSPILSWRGFISETGNSLTP
jgi:tetratricopeptide (TPR) repeat protein